MDGVIGHRSDPALHDRLHAIAHAGEVDLLRLPAADLPRHRLAARTEAGRLVHISLPRDQALSDGAVLHLAPALAIVLRVQQPRALRLVPRDAADALVLGWHAGNLHWSVRFEAGALVVPLDAPPESFLARLGELAAPGRLDVTIIDTPA